MNGVLPNHIRAGVVPIPAIHHKGLEKPAKLPLPPEQPARSLIRT